MARELVEKREYLAVYDYGMGGVWLVFLARTPDEIVRKYPDLEVMDPRPHWMPLSQYDDIKRHGFYDIDEPPTGWLEYFSNLSERRPGSSE